MPLYAVLAREYFGQRILGTVFGAATMLSSLGMALGPLAGGMIFDAYASYHWLFIRLGPYRPGCRGHSDRLPAAAAKGVAGCVAADFTKTNNLGFLPLIIRSRKMAFQHGAKLLHRLFGCRRISRRKAHDKTALLRAVDDTGSTRPRR